MGKFRYFWANTLRKERYTNLELCRVERYFDMILKNTPESVEDVMVEADGEWHTSDNKFASSGWRKAHPLGSTNGHNSGRASPIKKEPPRISPKLGSGSAKAREVIMLSDSEDDDHEEGLVRGELSPSSSMPRSQSQSTGSRAPPPSTRAAPSPEVIDLTLDSDDDDGPPPPPPPVTTAAKRKTSDLNSSVGSGGSGSNGDVAAPAWKKPRYDDSRGASPVVRSGVYTNGYTNGSASAPSTSTSTVTNGTTRYTTSNASPTLSTGTPTPTTSTSSTWPRPTIPPPAPMHPPYQPTTYHPNPNALPPVPSRSGSFGYPSGSRSMSSASQSPNVVHAQPPSYYGSAYRGTQRRD